jgi:hypothetical protein
MKIVRACPKENAGLDFIGAGDRKEKGMKTQKALLMPQIRGL